MEFSNKAVFSYNHNRKTWFGILTIFVIILLLTLIVGSTILYRLSDELSHIPLVSIITSIFETSQGIISHVIGHISGSTILGMLYTSLVGGLFFIYVPVEILFGKFILTQNKFLVLGLFIGGFIISYSLNYFIGMKFSVVTKKIITPKKFYKFKGFLNRKGGLAVYLINSIPFFPSQPFSALLGVFRYNLTRFYVYFLLGQLTKFLFIMFISPYIPIEKFKIT
jgi:membrane protein YqaA with SNARE-associated domain